jgi:hypothetical protein
LSIACLTTARYLTAAHAAEPGLVPYLPYLPLLKALGYFLPDKQ